MGEGGEVNDHTFCEQGQVLRKHGEGLAVLESKVNDLERVKVELFRQTKDIGDNATENKFNLHYIKNKLESGEVTKPLERKIDDLCREVRSSKNTYDSKHSGFEDRLDKLERSSWVTDILGLGIRKIVLAALVGAMFLGLINTAWWGLAKNYIFKEEPRQQQYLYLQMKEGQPPVVTNEPSPGSVPVKVAPIQKD